MCSASARGSALTSALVTGAGGFIGRALVECLATRGVRVRGIDRPGRADGVSIVAAELADPASARAAIASLKASLDPGAPVFHLAGLANASTCRKDPAGAFIANVTVTANVLEACRLAGLTRLVFPSTALVYALPAGVPAHETAALGPRSVYAATKVAAEMMLAGYAADFGFSVDVARLGNVYGPSGPRDSVVVTLLRQIVGDGGVRLRTLAPVRDFVHRNDVAEGLVRLAEAGGERGWRVFNLASGVPTSIADLAEMAGRTVGRALPPAETEPGSRRDDRIVLDVTKLRERTGWGPVIALADGLAQTLRAIREEQA